MILDYYQYELNNPDTRYFLIVSGDHSHDEDFVQYTWHRSRYNRVRPGDLFLYRKKDKNDIIGEFFFYGVGRFRTVNGDDEVIADLDKVHRFDENVTKSDLEGYEWHWKERGENWGHFFNQYGMDMIPKEDFVNILMKGFDAEREEEEVPEETTEFLNQIAQGNYFVDDNLGQSKRRRGQQDFSNTVKNNYGNKCCICGIATRHFLVGSHIIPWVTRKDIRLDPSNGLSLCALHDKAFDKGYLSLDKDYKVVVSKKISDVALSNELMQFNGNEIELPRRQKPKQEYLDHHRRVIFEKFLI